MKPKFTKYIFTIALIFLAGSSVLAQIPKGLNYQAVARDNDGYPISEKEVMLEITILSGSDEGTKVWQEIHDITTNEFGFFAVIIGEGNSTTVGSLASFEKINWSDNKYYMQARVDFGVEEYGNGLVDMGAVQLLSVPYALLADSALKAPAVFVGMDDITDVDLSGLTINQVLKWNGTDWIPGNAIVGSFVATDGTSDLTGDWIISSNNVSLTGGTLTANTVNGVTVGATTLTTETLELQAGAAVSSISVDVALGGAGASDVIISTQKAIKTYIDNALPTTGTWTLNNNDLYNSANNIGIGLSAPLEKFHAEVGTEGFLVTGTYDGGNITDLGGGAKMFFFPRKAAFRAGYLELAASDLWNDVNVGNASVAMGKDTKASGDFSVAFGNGAVATELLSFAMGATSTASGKYAFAFGNRSTSSGNYSHAFGINTTASGVNSFSFGNGTIASGVGAITFGFETKAAAPYSFVAGYQTESSGGIGATSIGYLTIAKGEAAVAMGRETVAEGDYSFAMGLNAIAKQAGVSAIALGKDVNAYAKHSVAIGYGVNAWTQSQFVIGQYNSDATNFSGGDIKWESDDRLFIIGNGTGIGAKSDAFVVYKDGKTSVGQSVHADFGSELLRVNGDIVANGTSYSSDARYKAKVETLPSALAKTLAMRGVYYNWKTEEFKEKDFSKERQVGFIAQEMEALYPELVKTDAKGYKSVDYAKITAILVEAIKEQQKIIEQLKTDNSTKTAQIGTLQDQFDSLASRIDSLESLLTNLSAKY